MKAAVKSQVLFLAAVFVFADCQVHNENESKIEDSSDSLEGGKNSTPIVGVQDLPVVTTTHPHPRPETEEDLVAEMEDLFKAMQLLGYDFERLKNSSEPAETAAVSGRMKMSDMFHPMMLVPQLIMWGFAPILLANLKMFVMQALMMNKMALNAAIFMTLRNIVFGPRPGPVVKYTNHGYHHHHKPSHHHHRRRSGI